MASWENRDEKSNMASCQNRGVKSNIAHIQFIFRDFIAFESKSYLFFLQQSNKRAIKSGS